MTVSLITCINEDFSIGKDNKLLYHIKKDLERFREKTLNTYCVMGKNTFFSLNKPFDKRVNVVITSNPHLKIEDELKEKYDILIESDLEKVLNQYKFTGSQDKDLFLCGGSRIYAEGIKYCDNLYITMVHQKGIEADTYFPSQELSNFTITHTEKHFDEVSGLYYSFINYKRKENGIEE